MQILSPEALSSVAFTPADMQASAGFVQLNELRMSELLASLSVALDITEGQPQGHAMRTTVIGMRLARQIGLPAVDQKALYYALLLKDLGCSSNAAKMCYLFGADDRLVKRDLKLVNWTKMADCFKFSMGHIAPDASPLQRVLKFVAMAREGQEGARKLVETRCERGAQITRMLRLPEATATAIHSLDEHWNGCGHAEGLRGEEIPLLARIACLAQTVEVFFTQQDLRDALDVAQQRSGQWFDPALVSALQSLRDEKAFWHGVATGDLRTQLKDYAPADETRFIDDDELDRVCEAFAAVVDAKSPWTHRHSQGVSEIAVGIAGKLGCSTTMIRDVRRAALLHDIGKLGVSNTILDKPGKPTDDEFAQIRKHSEYTELILREVTGFEMLADVAASHHERLDGRGYHRRLDAERVPAIGNLLSIADVYEAMTAKRPYRDGIPQERVLAILEKDLNKAFMPDYYEALTAWLAGNTPESRVETQLEAIDQLVAQL